jgi:hypothetical protein
VAKTVVKSKQLLAFINSQNLLDDPQLHHIFRVGAVSCARNHLKLCHGKATDETTEEGSNEQEFPGYADNEQGQRGRDGSVV